jgi:hypothetical protein
MIRNILVDCVVILVFCVGCKHKVAMPELLGGWTAKVDAGQCFLELQDEGVCVIRNFPKAILNDETFSDNVATIAAEWSVNSSEYENLITIKIQTHRNGKPFIHFFPLLVIRNGQELRYVIGDPDNGNWIRFFRSESLELSTKR